MPYERLSGQVIKAELIESVFFDTYARLYVRIRDDQIITLRCPPKDSGAWMGKKVSVVITTKEEQ